MQRLHTIPRLAWLAGAAVLIVAGGAAWLLLGSQSPQATVAATPTPTLSATASPRFATLTPELTPSPTATPTPPLTTCPLNGLPMSSPPGPGSHALIVQVENHPLARPTRNLTNADLVVEAPVEGNVTRFSVVFYCQPTVGLTGPVRSARYYNIDLWQQLHGLTVHFGASSHALARFRAAGMQTMNGITGRWPFFHRAGTAPAPHNLYVDVQAIRSATTTNASVRALADAAGTLRPPFRVGPAASVPNGTAVHTVTVRTNSYWTYAWTWDASLGAWRRSDGGSPDTDAATGKPITATSVVVQRITESLVYNDPDPAGNPREDLHLVGSGTGVLYVNGTGIPVRWSRPSASALTTWTYVDGSPMVLPPGQIWWEMVPVTGKISTS